MRDYAFLHIMLPIRVALMGVDKRSYELHLSPVDCV
jgi:hypothetical protein